ncbi:MAG TPA: cytochrome c oxidase subunit II [Nitrososphaerales archaeon]|nr:cytochrome c oxidase subunit II [Nitrososphaerales archaeon]
MLSSLPLDATPPTVQIFNTLQNYYLILGGAASVIVIGYMVFMIAKNRERPGRQVPAFHHEEGDWGNWKGVLLLLCVTGSVLAFVEYETFASANLISIPDPPSAIQVGVVGRQFVWSFTYPNGYTDFQNLTVPLDTIVILNITSADVTHGFYVPELDVAKDAQPGIYSQLWFNATQPGTFTIQCRQLCGVGHALMLSKLVVESASAYNAWYSKLPVAPSAKGGA